MAIRVALGAGPMRLLKQVMQREPSSRVIGGIAGVLFAGWGVELLKAIGTQTVRDFARSNIDFSVLAMTLAVASVPVLFSVLFPA